MSLALSQKENSSLLEVHAHGKLTHQDYEQLMPQIERMVERHGKIRVLFNMVDFHGWEAAALWDDAKFAARHFKDISKIAMIGEKSWEKVMSVICRPFTKGEVRYFDHSEMSLARNWLDTPRKERFAGNDIPRMIG